MSIERYFQNYTPICDSCGARLPSETSFQNAVQSKRNAGWESRKVDGEWEDVCADCLFEEKGYSHE